MSETAEAIDELGDRRRQSDTSEVFLYTFAAVGALTLAEMDGADAAVPGAGFGASIAALTAPLGHGAQTSLVSVVADNDPVALAGSDSEAGLSDLRSGAQLDWGSSFETSLSLLTGGSSRFSDPAAFAVVGTALGGSDILQTLGAYPSASPDASNASIMAAFGDVAASPMSSLSAVARD